MAQKVTKLSIDNNNSVSSVNCELPPVEDNDVRIQVLYSNISKSDLTAGSEKNKISCFGSETVGKVTAVGKNVGHCKVGQTVGVHC